MDLFRLQAFRDAARLGSLAAAARASGVDPSAISRAVSALEAELSVRLFQRTTRKLTLTEAGEVYLARIEPLIDGLADAGEAVAGLTEAPRGRLRVTASTAYGQAVIVPMLPSFFEAYPQVELDLVMSDDHLDLVAGRIDVAVRLGPPPRGDVVAARVTDVVRRVVASPAYLAASPPIREPADLAGRPGLVFPFDGYRSDWVFSTEGREVRVALLPRLATSNAQALRQAALDGLGVAQLADWLVDCDVALGRLVRVLPDWEPTSPGLETAVWVLYPSRAFLPAKARVFIDHLRWWIAETANRRWRMRADRPAHASLP